MPSSEPTTARQAAVTVSQVANWLRLFIAPGQVTELRALHVATSGFRRPHTEGGFFDDEHLDDMAKVALSLTGNARGVYFVMNPLTQDVLARRCNRVEPAETDLLAKDTEVIYRRWLLIDVDPVRTDGVSATDAEKDEAAKVAKAACQDLRSRAWPEPIQADSGNGYHLFYRLDLSRDDGDLVKRTLHALGKRFDTDTAKIDPKVFNPSRIVKLPGTWARKGDNIADRPHRPAKVTHVPERIDVVSQEQLAAFVQEVLGTEKPQSNHRTKAASAKSSKSVIDPARAYVQKVPPAISGQGGHNQTYKAACILVDGFNLSAEDAWPVLLDWNERCSPPWTERELQHKLDDTIKNTKRSGYLLNGDGRGPSAANQTTDADYDAWEAESRHDSEEAAACQSPPANGQQAAPATPDTSQAPPTDPSIPLIYISTDEQAVNAAAVQALAGDAELYQRGGKLVHVVRLSQAEESFGLKRPADCPLIRAMPTSLLREHIATVAKFVMFDARKKSLTPKHPPKWCVAAVADRGQWDGIRHLEGVVDSPVLRPDGTILDQPGYDPASGLLYLPNGASPVVPDRPLADEVAEAVDLLLNVVVDFPFTSPEHRAGWLAYVLTPLARHAFTGPSPLFVIDSNVRGAGKTLLGVVGGIIVTGRDMPVTAAPDNNEEMRKSITSTAIGGDTLVLLDNVAGILGCSSLNEALTGTTWGDRLLGKNEKCRMPLLTTWAATGNNVALHPETSRRVLHIRLESAHENPEDRTGFAVPDLRAYVLENRSNLLVAALTILRGFCASGRPDMKLRPWGSYEGWSSLVRGAIVAAGQPDPANTRIELRKTSDFEFTALPALLLGIKHLDPSNSGLTVGEILERCALDAVDLIVRELREAIETLCPQTKATSRNRSLGMRLHHLRGRVCQGMRLARRDARTGAKWFVETIEMEPPRD